MGYVCRATNELGEDMTEANLVCRPLPHLQFQLPPFETEDPSEQLQLIKEATQRHGVRAKLRGDEMWQPDEPQAPRFLLKMESFPKILAGQGVNLETFVVPVGDPDMKLEWFLSGEPLLFKSSFTPVYDFGFVGLAVNKVYPDDFGESLPCSSAAWNRSTTSTSRSAGIGTTKNWCLGVACLTALLIVCSVTFTPLLPPNPPPACQDGSALKRLLEKVVYLDNWR